MGYLRGPWGYISLTRPERVTREAAPHTPESNRCVVIVWRREGVPAQLARALALVSHVQALHPHLQLEGSPK